MPKGICSERCNNLDVNADWGSAVRYGISRTRTLTLARAARVRAASSSEPTSVARYLLLAGTNVPQHVACGAQVAKEGDQLS